MTHHWQARAQRAENRCKHLEAQLSGKQTEIDALKYRLERTEEALRKATTKPKAERRAVLQFPLHPEPGPEPRGAA
jgi:predicted  nucleic acid-binding Zn-ribbon protein